MGEREEENETARRRRGAAGAVRKSHSWAPQGPGPHPDQLRPAVLPHQHTSAAHLRNGGSGPRARPFLPRGWLASIPTEGSRYFQMCGPARRPGGQAFQMCRRVCRFEPERTGVGAELPGAQGWGLFPELAPLPSSGSELFSELCRLCPRPPMCSGSQLCLGASMGERDLPSPRVSPDPHLSPGLQAARAVAENPSRPHKQTPSPHEPPA